MEEASISISPSKEESDSSLTQHAASTSYEPREDDSLSKAEEDIEDLNKDSDNHIDPQRTPSPHDQQADIVKTTNDESSEESRLKSPTNPPISHAPVNDQEIIEKEISAVKIDSSNENGTHEKVHHSVAKDLKTPVQNASTNPKTSASTATPGARTTPALRTPATRSAVASKSSAQVTTKSTPSKPLGERAASATRTPRPASVNGFQPK